MEGKYTKISTIVAVFALGITLWQLLPSFSSKKNYSGVWRVESEIQSAKMNKYIGSKIQWIFTINQSGNDLYGSAEKVSVNSMRVPNDERNTITMNGTLEGSAFVLNFVEKGKLRETRGQFKGEFAENNFKGTFMSTASEARGIIRGHKSQ